MTNTLSKYYKKRKKKIISFLKKPVREYNREDYHYLRVEIKKLNAILDLIEDCFKNFKKKYFKPVKKIFRQSGKVREFQLEESALKKYESFSPERYLCELKKRIKKEQNNFHFLVNKKLKKKIKKLFKRLAPFIKMVQEKDVNTHLEKERKKIVDLIRQKPLQPVRMHELRKRLKVNFNNKLSMSLQDDNNLNKEDNFQELLGKWHDGSMLVNHLEKSIIKKQKDPIELLQLMSINKEIKLDTQNLLEEINKQLETKNLFI